MIIRKVATNSMVTPVYELVKLNFSVTLQTSTFNRCSAYVRIWKGVEELHPLLPIFQDTFLNSGGQTKTTFILHVNWSTVSGHSFCKLLFFFLLDSELNVDGKGSSRVVHDNADNSAIAMVFVWSARFLFINIFVSFP